jgi:hypothetical protein
MELFARESPDAAGSWSPTRPSQTSRSTIKTSTKLVVMGVPS